MDLNSSIDLGANCRRGLRASEITVKNLADYLKLNFQSLTQDETAELATFLQIAQTFIEDYTGLTSSEVDEHENLVIAVFVLVQDMYDNRCYYVDKSNLNRVVEMILGMHSVNLL